MLTRPDPGAAPRSARIVIVGAGLSGLYAAALLRQQGEHDLVVLESRERTGGRIETVAHESARGRFDLGPTWVWPDMQPQLHELLRVLDLAMFEQPAQGDMLVERVTGQPPQRTRSWPSSPASMRLHGGMAALTETLFERLDASRVLTGRAVRGLRRDAADAGGIELDVALADGGAERWHAGQVLLALPPRLAAQNIAFEPALPPQLARQWLATPTWMAPHAKYLAVFDVPFWRELGLSGQAHSAGGPLVEIHDATAPDGSAALFGFVGVPARVRQRVGREELLAHCRAQLVRLFGPQAATPRAEWLRDWAGERDTATADDLDAVGQHAPAPLAAAAAGPWQGCLRGIGSEWSPEFPGYVAGAIDAATRGVAELLAGAGG